jgi:hypothetical protein
MVTPEELLRRRPRETVRRLLRRLGPGQRGLGRLIGADSRGVAGWEAGQHTISPRYRGRLAALLAPHRATSEGAAFGAPLGQAEEG